MGDPVKTAGPAGVAGLWPLTTAVLVGVTAFLALFVTIGADCLWLVALGHRIVDDGAIPAGVPFAAAPSDHWPNVVVLAQLVMAAVHGLGAVGLPALQLALGALALGLMAQDARRSGATDGATAGVLFLFALGALSTLGVVRLQMFSLVPFALLLLLLREDQRSPSRWIWAFPVLVAVWNNLHGAVLVGLGIGGAYLLLHRLRIRPGETVAVGVVALLAMLVTPAGLGTVVYYRDVLTSEAASRGEGLWARPDPTNPFDVLMVLAGLVLLVLALRHRRALWEHVVLAVLLLGTLSAARHGVWLLMAASTSAALTLSRRTPAPAASPRAARSWLAGSTLVGAALVLVILVPRGEEVLPEPQDLVDRVAAEAGDRVVLAPEPLAESLAVEGVTLWAANPVDAFGAEDQRAFLDFLYGGRNALRAVEASEVVVVEEGTDAAVLMEGLDGFTASPLPGDWTLYQR